MALTLTHAEYSRGRLLHLLDELDGMPAGTVRETFAAPAGTLLPAPASGPDDALWAAMADHAGRSEIGAFVYLATNRAWLVAPPYPVHGPVHQQGCNTAVARALVTSAYRIGAVLLRLGGYAVGIYDGDHLVEARNDQRFVKNRHRKGGQSQRRFDRIREKQTAQLFEQLCDEAEKRLRPHVAGLDFIVFGGDGHTVQAFLKECRYLRELPVVVLPRFLTVPEPRHETLVTLPALLSGSRVTAASI